MEDCDCTCHADPEILLCGKCNKRHDIDKIMATADSVVFADDGDKEKVLCRLVRNQLNG